MVVRCSGVGILVLALALSGCVSQTQQSHKLNNNSPAAYIAVGGILVVGGGILTYDSAEHSDHYNYGTAKLFTIIGVIAMVTGAVGIVRGVLMLQTSDPPPQ